HESAITAAGNHHAAGVEIGLCSDPVKQGVDVLVRAFAQQAIIERQKGLAVAARSTNVGVDHRDAQFVDVIQAAPNEIWAKLSLWSAVNVDHDGPLARKPCRRAIEKPADRAIVPTFPVNEIRLAHP